MAEKRKSLGRGLDALLGGAAQEQEKPNPKSLNELPIEEIGPGPVSYTHLTLPTKA